MQIHNKEASTSKRKIDEGAVIHSVETFENNKPFNDEDDIISTFIISPIAKNFKAAISGVDPFLSSAQAQDGDVAGQHPDAGTDGELPPLRRSARLRCRLRDLPGDQLQSGHYQ